MIKLRRLFYKVFSVEYADELVLELQKVEKSGIHFEDTKSLVYAFTWGISPQGDGFWKDVCNKLPAKYQK